MIRRPPRSTRTDHTLSLHDALPICRLPRSTPSAIGQRRVTTRSETSLPSRTRSGMSRLRFTTELVASLLSWTRLEIARATRTILPAIRPLRSEEHTYELPSIMRISYAVYCLNKKYIIHYTTH